jgi:signal transduction histidine kinase
MTNSVQLAEHFAALATHLAHRRTLILDAWREAVDQDAELTTASTVSRAQFNDHIPQVLDAFERELRAVGPAAKQSVRAQEQEGAAEHGLHRWQQGYDQRETMREWGHLHLCLLEEIERFGALQPDLDPSVLPHARRALVRLCNAAVCESAARFTLMKRAEAASRERNLQEALAQLTALEKERAEAWREAAHDLRGSVSVISSAAALLNRQGIPDPTRTHFSQVLRKGVVSLHDLLSDLISLARLEAGHEKRSVSAFDAALLIREFCDALRPLAAERNLFLQFEGPESLPVQGDPAKIRRIAQNLVLNALNVTREGGVVVSCQDAATADLGQWELSVKDTGPGFRSESAPVLERALKEATEEAHHVDERAERAGDPSALTTPPDLLSSQTRSPSRHDLHGEGIGLLIVKRLCELLDAGLELESASGTGTTFRVRLPRTYAN